MRTLANCVASTLLVMIPLILMRILANCVASTLLVMIPLGEGCGGGGQLFSKQGALRNSQNLFGARVSLLSNRLNGAP